MHGWQSEPTDGPNTGWGSRFSLSLSLSLSVSLVLCLSPSISLCLYNIYLAACPCVIFFSASLSVSQYLSVYLPVYLSPYVFI